MKRGLVIGKFNPPHRGHKLLIETATAQVDHLDVIVCARADQRIPGSQRAEWLRKIHPSVHVRVIDDPGRDCDSKFWADYTRRILGYAPDVVFTSEHYGENYARFLGCAHVSVDRDRSRVPISASKIRENPLAYLDYVEPCVRAFFVKRIAIVGAESTGKTTLAEQLASHYGTVWVPEYGREYTEVNIGPAELFGYQWRTEEFVHIARRQVELEDEVAVKANRVLICDTDALATCIWHQRYTKSWSREVEEIASKRRYDLYLLTDCNVEFVQDGIRDGEHLREWMTQRFREELESRHLSWLLLQGNYEQRFHAAVAAIDSLLLEQVKQV